MKAKYRKIKYVPFNSLPGAIDCSIDFSFIINEDAHLTIVDAMRVLEEVDQTEYPELYDAIDKLKAMDFIGFD
jgi:hypothetical protein